VESPITSGTVVGDVGAYSTLGGMWEMTRPGTPAAAAVLAAVGAWIGGNPTLRVLPLMAATALAVAAANVFNDRCDVVADRVNRPDRPIVAGTITLAGADTFVIGSSLLAIAVAGSLGAGVAVATGLVLAGGLTYSLLLQRIAFVGQLAVAALFAAPLVYGAVFGADGTNPRTWTAFALALVYVAGREVLKGIPDVAGDEAAGYRTPATILGEDGALRVYRVAAVGFCLASATAAVVLRDAVFLATSAACAIVPTARIMSMVRGVPSSDTVDRAIAFSGIVFASGIVPLLTLAR
jgi:geranylgeranylglycerol-phosphate geranylgeranyltransferase